MVGHRAVWLIAVLAFVAVPHLVSAKERSAAGSPHRVGTKPVHRQTGKASYYGSRFEGRKTASGKRFHKNELTAASPNLPLGSKARVVNEKTGKSVDVKVTDRMPAKTGRTIDLSEGAAKQVGMKKRGVAPVHVVPTR